MELNKILKTVKLSNKSSVLLVDVSYYTYTRFFSTRIWYINSHKDEGEIDLSQDWTKNEDFMTSFRRLFFSKMNAIIKSYNIPSSNVIFAVDSSFNNNWRLAMNKDYKLTRKDAHKRNQFNSWDIFRIVKEELLPSMYSQDLILEVEGLEGDDIVALLVRELKKRDPTTSSNRSMKYYILANDKDYIQICNDRTILVDSKGNNISDKALTDCSNLEYLIKKILLGDKSDNIEACYMKHELIKIAELKSKKEELKCTPAKVRDLLANSEGKEIIMHILSLIRGNEDQIKEGLIIENKYFVNHQFSKNAKMIDFAQIPSCYICKCKF
jgi:5'-3' exonuclease